MAYEDWVLYDDVEVINVARTARRAEALGLGLLIPEARIAVLQDLLSGGSEYSEPGETPWYEPDRPETEEFAGLLPLGISGLGDSTRTASTVEYTGDGGHSGSARNGTASLVFTAVIIATSDRGADYGKRWLDSVLAQNKKGVFCSGADLDYFRFRSRDYEDGAEQVHMRDVSLTRGVSVTSKRRGSCRTFWWVQWTMTAGDPYEYGLPVGRVTSIGGATAAGPGVVSEGTSTLTQTTCPVYDYTPIYDPMFPALVPSPTSPTFLPAGWGITPGMTFQRKWARITPVRPYRLMAVPLIKITSTTEARMVRVSVWPAASATNDQCDPLYSAVLTYLPPNLPVYLDGERNASYAWDGASAAVRRTDSLVYSPEALPVRWTAFNDPAGLLVTLDLMQTTPGNYQGGGNVRASVSMIPRTD